MIKSFCSDVRDGLGYLEDKRRHMDLLDVRCKLVQESQEKVAYL